MLKPNLLKIFIMPIMAIALFGADKTNTINPAINQNILDALQAMTGEPGATTANIANVPVPSNKTPSQQSQPQDKGCTKIIVDNRTVIYNCGDKTFLKRFGTDSGLFLILSDGKKVKLTD